MPTMSMKLTTQGKDLARKLQYHEVCLIFILPSLPNRMIEGGFFFGKNTANFDERERERNSFIDLFVN